MDNIMISAVERTEKPNKVRKQGFIPGVIFGKGIESKNVKIEERELAKVQHGHLRNARLKVKMGEDVKHCIVKEIQRDPVKGNVIHFNLQSIHDNDIIKLSIPVVFTGKDKLSGKQLLLDENINEVEISGKVSMLPEAITIDVSKFNVDAKITLKDLPVQEGIKVLGNEDEIVAVVSYARETPEEEATEAEAEQK